jgi:hypothetical protein
MADMGFMSGPLANQIRGDFAQQVSNQSAARQSSEAQQFEQGYCFGAHDVS